MSTSTVVAIVLIVALVLLLAAVVAAAARKRRTARLRDSFGPEYDRTVEDAGRRRDAEKELLARREEHEQLQLRPLTPAARDRFSTAWAGVQSRFVDTPAVALTEADALVTELLTERGYPVEDFDTKSRLLSVEHAGVMDSYRSAHAVEVASRARTADTETVRNAFLDFRRVFEDVMSDGADEPYPAEESTQGRQRSRKA